MSHITAIATVITDLDALEKALTEFPGATLHRGQTRFHSYQGSLECDHAIHVAGVSYEIGLKNGKGDGYALLKDFYGYAGGRHDGHKLQALFGDECGRLVQSYGACKAERLLQRKGYTGIRRTRDESGVIRIRATASR